MILGEDVLRIKEKIAQIPCSLTFIIVINEKSPAVDLWGTLPPGLLAKSNFRQIVEPPRSGGRFEYAPGSLLFRIVSGSALGGQ